MGISSLSFSQFPIDWVILGCIVVLLTIDTLRSSANRACSLALALPIATALYDALSHAAFIATAIQGISSPYAQPVIFLIILVISYLLTHRILGFYGDASGRPIQSLLVGIATTGLLVLFWIQTPLITFYHFGPQAQNIFGESYRFWWLLISYVLLAGAKS